RPFGGIDDQSPAREPLAYVVVGISFEYHRHEPRCERAEALSRGAHEVKPHGVFRKARAPVLAGELAPENRADRSVHVLDRQYGLDRLALFEGRLAYVEERRHVERRLEPVVLLHLVVSAPVLGDVRLVEYVREVYAPGFPVVDDIFHFELVCAPDHFVYSPESELGHELAHFFRDKAHKVYDVPRIARELLPELRVLRGDADGA